LATKKKTSNVVIIRLDMTDNDFNRIATAAHKLDLSINQWMDVVISEVLEDDMKE